MSLGAQRSVGRLHVRAQDLGRARRAESRIEDALRTASLPEDGGRLLLVRKLDLGRVDLHASPVALARQVERAFARDGQRCVHALEPRAARADAVWFRDALEAHVERARRLLCGAPADEWFWRGLLPPLPARDIEAGSGLRALLGSLAARPEAVVAVPRWLATVDALGGLAPLGQAMSAQDLCWLEAVLQGPGGPSSPRRESATGREAGASSEVAPDERGDAETSTTRAVGRERWLRGIAETAVTDATAVSNADAIGALSSSNAALQQAADGSFAIAGGARSAAGGLLFLLPVLARLGYAEWLNAQAEWTPFSIARRVLQRVLWRLRVDDNDVAWSLVEVPPLPDVQPPAFAVPPGWREGLGFAPVLDGSPRSRAVSERIVQAWHLAAQRWLRCYVGLSLGELVLRPATLEHTPTHVDLRFDHAQVDLRVRRAGLDLDPGWLPWFGRVARFGYEQRGLR